MFINQSVGEKNPRLDDVVRQLIKVSADNANAATKQGRVPVLEVKNVQTEDAYDEDQRVCVTVQYAASVNSGLLFDAQVRCGTKSLTLRVHTDTTERPCRDNASDYYVLGKDNEWTLVPKLYHASALCS